MEKESKKEKGSGNLFSTTNLLVLVLLVGLVLGALAEHKFIEPALNESAKKLAACENTNVLLNSEIVSCYKKVADLNKEAS